MEGSGKMFATTRHVSADVGGKYLVKGVLVGAKAAGAATGEPLGLSIIETSPEGQFFALRLQLVNPNMAEIPWSAWISTSA